MNNNMMTINSTSRAFRQLPTYKPSYIDNAVASFDECLKKEAEKGLVQNDRDGINVDEYRANLYNRLQNLSYDSTNRMDTTIISISDAGIKRMMDDSEFEKWVVGQVKSMFSTNDPFSGLAGGKLIIMRFGENESDLDITMERAGFPNGQDSMMPKVRKDEDDSFWKRRVKSFEEQMELNEEINDKEKSGIHIYAGLIIEEHNKCISQQ